MNGVSTGYTYAYDSKGNITRVVDGNNDVTTYTYDDLGQLISEVKGNTTRTYTYDNAGNITSITDTTERETLDPDPGFGPIIHWDLTPPTVISSTQTLGYTNSQWGDLLTSYNGHAITYDGIGNPLSYYNGSSYTFTWEGRRLVGAVKGSNTMSFEYNDEGIRTSKTVNGVETVYYVNGGQIVAEKTGTRTIVYIYDASDTPIGMMYRTNSYAGNTWDVFWYEKNLQGDIVAVYNSSGTKLVTYDYYDAWGNYTVSYSNSGASTGAQYNPFRYRGYYYDTDLGMYYLQSRYYDAKICRFISADGYVSTGQGILNHNMFVYGVNNPTKYMSIAPHYNGKHHLDKFAIIVKEVHNTPSSSIESGEISKDNNLTGNDANNLLGSNDTIIELIPIENDNGPKIKISEVMFKNADSSRVANLTSSSKYINSYLLGGGNFARYAMYDEFGQDFDFDY